MNPDTSPSHDPFQDYDPQACYETLVNAHEPIERRMQALLYILQGNSVDALMALLPLFEKSGNMELEVRQAIAIAFGEWGSESSTEALLSCVDDASEEKSLRLVALQSLAKTQHAKALDRLMLALQDEDNDFFATAADALEHFGQSALPELCLMLQQGKTDVQCIAAWHLGKLKTSQGIPHLLNALKTHAHTDVLALCAWALGEIGEARQEVLQVLKEKISHPDAEVAQRAKDAYKKVSRNLN